MSKPETLNELTGREREIALLVSEGLSNKAVANRLGIAEGTVKTHLRSVMRKTRTRNRTMLAAILLLAISSL